MANGTKFGIGGVIGLVVIGLVIASAGSSGSDHDPTVGAKDGPQLVMPSHPQPSESAAYVEVAGSFNQLSKKALAGADTQMTVKINGSAVPPPVGAVRQRHSGWNVRQRVYGPYPKSHLVVHVTITSKDPNRLLSCAVWINDRLANWTKDPVVGKAICRAS